MLTRTNMPNPWLDLPRNPLDSRYILEMDRAFVEHYNTRYTGHPRKRLMVKSIPEPFIGCPETARLVLLNLNPGHSDEDEEQHRGLELKEAIFRNLRGEFQEYPFYPLNPAFAHTGVGRWWCNRTEKLHKASGLTAPQFAQSLLVIEWFPYHSKECGLGEKPTCGESQRFSHHLAKEMLNKKGALVLGMKARKRWVNVDPLFEQVPFLKSRQNASITRNNMKPGLFDSIVSALQAP
jgi:hypothetical protein